MKDNIALEKAIELADEIGDVYQGNDWLVVKKYILKYLNPTYRRRFSTRDEKTKKHTINDFESSLIDYYQQQFNVRLELDEEKKL